MLPVNKVLSPDAMARVVENMPKSEEMIGSANMHQLMELIQEKERLLNLEPIIEKVKLNLILRQEMQL